MSSLLTVLLPAAHSDGSGGHVAHGEHAAGGGVDAAAVFGAPYLSAVHVGPG